MKESASDLLDVMDQKILRILQEDGRASASAIADQVGLSLSPCARRIRRLEDSGVLAAFRARLAPARIGLTLTVFVNVSLRSHQEAAVNAFEHEVRVMPEVTDCWTVSGASDYLIKVVCRDNRHYETCVRRLQRLEMVNTIDSRFVIRTVKEDGPLDLPDLE